MNWLKTFRIPLLVLIMAFTCSNTGSITESNFYAPPLWHDLVTPNMYASKKFYGEVFGWTFKDVPGKGLGLTTIYNGGKAIGGMIEIPKANTSVWVKAVPVTGLSAKITAIEQAGGGLALPPVMLKGRGMQAILQGAQGEEFSLVENPEAMLTAVSSGENGWLWSELWAENTADAASFYKMAFDVVVEEQNYDNKPYWVLEANGEKLAGMIMNPVDNQGTRWVPYVRCSDPSAMESKVTTAGGDVLLGTESGVRGGAVVIVQDPQGAVFCIQKPIN
ncbi:VOC family protein [Robertkochia solimangrovi]|uniref:VOC family protein n=1 Tax=Robertkochia solimangrovi TaxID=2213046 RepID=UPI00117FEAE8|nr:VOC family protein [Robertkochia solimangrovi]TRZ41431.1 hypothetical protein DMZ48_17255 [Robertkochia solimangrovi]